MTTEIATTADDSAIELLPPARTPSLGAREMLVAHAEMMQTAFELAENMCRTKLVPQRFQGKPQEGTAAILYGAELGLNPIQSLQRVVPIHGMPTLEARTMVALLKPRGYKVKTVAQSDESVTVRGVDLDGDEYESTWTIERARKAGYVPTPASDDSLCRPDVDSDWVTVTKTWDGRAKTSVLGNMKYITDPQAMLKAKAQAEVCRDMAPEVLMGITYSREDLESQHFDDRPPPAEAATRSAPITVEEILGDTTPVVEQPAPPPRRGDQTDPPRVIRQPDDDGAPQDRAYDPGGEDAGSDAGTEDGPPPPATAAQNRKMHAVFRDVGLTDRQDRLIICGEIVGYNLTSSKDLTTVEASTIIDTLERWRDDPDVGVDARLTEILQRWAARQTDPEPAAEAQADDDGGA